MTTPYEQITARVNEIRDSKKQTLGCAMEAVEIMAKALNFATTDCCYGEDGKIRPTTTATICKEALAAASKILEGGK